MVDEHVTDYENECQSAMESAGYAGNIHQTQLRKRHNMHPFVPMVQCKHNVFCDMS